MRALADTRTKQAALPAQAAYSNAVLKICDVDGDGSLVLLGERRPALDALGLRATRRTDMVAGEAERLGVA